jgi:hypothetical protein
MEREPHFLGIKPGETAGLTAADVPAGNVVPVVRANNDLNVH